MGKNNRYYIIHKPYKVLSQFTNESGNQGLKERFPMVPKGVYPVGRLDLDSEGLLILTDDKKLNHQLLNPTFGHERTYWVEVDGVPSTGAIESLKEGVEIRINGKVHKTKPASVSLIQPEVVERIPPVNYVKHPSRQWLEIRLTEGKNRQVRRMTAKVGHPTLRLIRVAIEGLQLTPLKPGEMVQISEKAMYRKLNLS